MNSLCNIILELVSVLTLTNLRFLYSNGKFFMGDFMLILSGLLNLLDLSRLFFFNLLLVLDNIIQLLPSLLHLFGDPFSVFVYPFLMDIEHMHRGTVDLLENLVLQRIFNLL